MTKSLNAREMTAILSKVWASTEDIKRIGCVGKNKALEIKKEIRNQMKENNMIFPRNLVAMEYVIKYFQIDEKRIRTRLQHEIGGLANG